MILLKVTTLSFVLLKIPMQTIHFLSLPLNRTKDKMVSLSYIVDDHALSVSIYIHVYIFIYLFIFIYIYIVLIFTHLSEDVLSIRTKRHTFGLRKINRMIDSLVTLVVII